MFTFLSIMYVAGICFYIGYYAGVRQTHKDIDRAWKELDDELREI